MTRFSEAIPEHRDHRGDSSRHTILIVQADPDEDYCARTILADSEHWLIDTAGTVETALSLIATRNYCAVLADYNLPDGNIIPVVDWTRGDSPVIVMASLDDSMTAVEMLRRGAYDYIVKDDSFADLLPELLKRALEKHGDNCELARLREDIQTQSRQLTKANARLRSLDSLRSELLSEASNEIQQPLNIIRQFMSVMSEETVDSITATQKGYLDSVSRNCDLLELLIGDVFQLQGLETGNHPVRRYRARARTLLDTTVKRIVESLPAEGRKLTVGQLEDDIFVLCDSELLTQSLQNLIEAVFALTPRGGKISLASKVEEQELVVEVTSDGPAMTYAEQRKVFDRFGAVAARSGQSRLRTGLELAIAQAILERHDGQVALQSEPRQGNTFRVAIPLWDGHRQLAAFLKDRMNSSSRINDRLAFSMISPCWTSAESEYGLEHDDQERSNLLHHIAASLVSQFKLKPDNLLTVVPENAVAVLTSTGDSGGLMLMHRLIDKLAHCDDLAVPIYCSTVIVTQDIAAEDWIAIARNRAVLVQPSDRAHVDVRFDARRCALGSAEPLHTEPPINHTRIRERQPRKRLQIGLLAKQDSVK
ncbi:response regulator [candidate division GN15 bacterium]|nr:response regulator [candidate division GN15 bacterium]